MRGLFIALLLVAFSAHAEDFPMPGCHGWQATTIARAGLNTTHATMTGQVTPDNIIEYCIRQNPSSGPDDLLNTPDFLRCQRDAISQINQLAPPFASANCRTHELFFQEGDYTISVTFPPTADQDVSCASGYPGLEDEIPHALPGSLRRAKSLGGEMILLQATSRTARRMAGAVFAITVVLGFSPKVDANPISADCLVEIEGEVVIDGPCQFFTGGRGSKNFEITQLGKIASLSVHGNSRTGDMTFTDPDNGSPVTIPFLSQRRACWANDYGKICAWKVGEPRSDDQYLLTRSMALASNNSGTNRSPLFGPLGYFHGTGPGATYMGILPADFGAQDIIASLIILDTKGCWKVLDHMLGFIPVNEPLSTQQHIRVLLYSDNLNQKTCSLRADFSADYNLVTIRPSGGCDTDPIGQECPLNKPFTLSRVK